MATSNTKTQTKAAAEKTTAEAAPAPAKRQTTKKVDPNAMIPVRNGFQGMLIYVSPHTKETFVWNHFGDEQEMERSELKRAKAASKDFFANNWFILLHFHS